MNDFKNDLQYSASAKEFWNNAYKKAFPIMIKTVDYSGNMKAQAIGIDTVIVLPLNGRLRIDEKMRRKNRGDVLIEYVSNDKTSAPGWIEKDLKIDFIGYAYMDTRDVLFIDFGELQKRWSERKIEWLQKYNLPPAKNKTYNTLNVAVPLSELKGIHIIKVKA